MEQKQNVMVTAKHIEIKRYIERVCKGFDHSGRLLNDPVEFPHRYKDKRDIEIAGLISAVFSYGRVDLFKPVIERILEALGPCPYEFLINFSLKKDGRAFKGIYYRFQKDRDIMELIRVLSEVLRRFKDIEEAFMRFYSPQDDNTGGAIEGFSRYILGLSGKRSEGIRQLFPLPSKGSACKRLNLFLRWMVRHDHIDLGIWKGIPKNRLVIPLDVHIARLAIATGITERKTPDWKMALEITEFLKGIDPEDPLKYDFVLCHAGMMGLNKKV